MTAATTADDRLAGRRSLGLLLTLLLLTLSTVFGGEVLIMYLLERLLPPDTDEWVYILLDAGALSLLVVMVVLPFMLHLRSLHLRQARNTLRMQYTLDHHAIVSITDAHGIITFVNDRFCKTAGYAREELIGRSHAMLKSGTHGIEFYRDMWVTITSGRVWHGDICNRAKEGHLYWVRATITPFLNTRGIPEEYVAIRTDITEQKQLEEFSRQQEARFRAILDNLGEGVYTLDSDGRVTYLNKEGERLLGWSVEDLRGRILHEAIHHHRPDGQPLPLDQCPIRIAMEEGRTYRSGDEVFFRKDGSILPVKITGAPMQGDGERLGSVAVFADASEERLLQQHLMDAANAAERAAHLKSDFLSTMSHEIRTPLNGVVGMTDLLLDTPLNGEQAEFARLIKASADALMGIVSDILDFSKIEAGRLVLETTDFSLRQSVESTLDVVTGKLVGKTVLLSSFIAPELPDHLIGDPTRLRQILLNFLSNALKFTGSGSVTVSATPTPDAQAHPGRIAIRLAVQDTGIGIKAADRARLFRPFVQTDSSTTRKYGGTGLGLSICKRLAEAMGGTVGVESEPGKGAVFWADVSIEVGTEKRLVRTPASEYGNRRILLAGSKDQAAGVWERYLLAWGLNFESVESLPELEARVASAVATQMPYQHLLLADPLRDCSLREAVQALQSAISLSSVLCVAPVSDRAFRAALSELGVQVIHGPLRQSALLTGLDGTPALDGSPPARRADDADLVAATVPLRGTGQRLLLAEDNSVNQRVALRMIERLGYVADLAVNGADAVAAAATGIYQLVLMDCQMPEMDGFAATMAIRRAEAGRSRHLPIIAMTANALQGDRERCIAAGMDDYLSKPIDAARLADMLARWLAVPAPAEAGGRSQGDLFGSLPRTSSDATGPEAGFDLGRLGDLFADDEEGLEELMEALGETLEKLRQRMTRVETEPLPDISGSAHELRGLAQNVGAHRLADAAARLHSHASLGDRAACAQEVPAILEESARIIEFIARRPQRQKA